MDTSTDQEQSVGPETIPCPQCGVANVVSDQFCQGCGAATRTAEEDANPFHLTSIKQARLATGLLAFTFFLSGLLFFGLAYSESMDALANLEGYDSEMPWPSPLLGEVLTVGELRAQVRFELWGVLILNALLGVLMLGLRVWSKRKPFAAMVAAACAYGAVVVGNAVIDPATITQGMFLKIFVAIALYRGLKASIDGRNATT